MLSRPASRQNVSAATSLLLFVVRGTHMAGQRPGGVLTDKTCAASFRYAPFPKLFLAVKHASRFS